MAEYNKPLPLVTDPEHAPFWEGTKRHELLVRKCKHCEAYQFPARPMCASCHSFDFEWVKTAGKGTLISYTVAERAWDPSFEKDVPFGVVIVKLDEGPGMLGNSEGIKPQDLKIGIRMEAVFKDVTDTVTLVNWKPLSRT